MAYLSIMIPVYNGEDLVAQAIESVINQPYEDWEIIIMNDGSSDSTERICKDYASRDSRIHLYTHDNMGLGKNRNIGFQYLTGTWTIFLDHDDTVINGFYSKACVEFLKTCEKNHIEVIVPSRMRTDYEMKNGDIDKVYGEEIVEGGNEPSWKIEHEFATLIYSTDLLKRENIRFYEGKPEMESIFRHKAVYLANNVLFTNQFFFAVRRGNPNSISNTWNFINVLPIRMKAYAELAYWHKKYDSKDVLVWKRTIEEIAGMISTYFYLALDENNSYKMFLKKINDLEIDKYIQLFPDELSKEKRKILNDYRRYPFLKWIESKIKKFIKKILPKRVKSLYPLAFSEIEYRANEFSKAYTNLCNEIEQINTI